MEFIVVLHKAEEGGYWAEVPSLVAVSLRATPLKRLCMMPVKPSRRI